jgi:hypothetical protein
VPGGPRGETKSLGDRVLEKLKRTVGVSIDQLTINKVMELTTPQRTQAGLLSTVHLSPFDGLPLDETFSAISLVGLTAGDREDAKEAPVASAVSGSSAIDFEMLREEREERARRAGDVASGAGAAGNGWARGVRRDGGGGQGQCGGGGSGIDWRKSFRLLSTMESMCHVMSARFARA